jgi:LmbE family N-acetylglucosaminyl deacetylase
MGKAPIPAPIAWTMRQAFRLVAPTGMKNMLALHKLWLERQPWPDLVELPPGRDILVLAPHFDDEAIGPGGTLAKHAQAGHRVTVVFMTDGRRGGPTSYGEPLPPTERTSPQDAVMLARKAEAAEAVRILGISAAHHLDAPDEGLAPTREIVGRLEGILKAVRPDLVYLPFITDRMPDHVATNAILVEASDETMTFQVCGYEVWNPLYANIMVNIEATFSQKCDAIRAHASQMRFNNYVACAAGLNAYRAMCHLNGEGHAEAFYLASLQEYRYLFEALRV